MVIEQMEILCNDKKVKVNNFKPWEMSESFDWAAMQACATRQNDGAVILLPVRQLWVAMRDVSNVRLLLTFRQNGASYIG